MLNLSQNLVSYELKSSYLLAVVLSSHGGDDLLQDVVAVLSEGLFPLLRSLTLFIPHLHLTKASRIDLRNELSKLILTLARGRRFDRLLCVVNHQRIAHLIQL